MDTLRLSTTQDAYWDFDLDALGNFATAGDTTAGQLTGRGYRMAQDVATQCLSWRGEVYYDTTVGIPYDTVLGGPPNLVLISALYEIEAKKVVDVQQCVPELSFTSGASRRLSGTIYVADDSGTFATMQL